MFHDYYFIVSYKKQNISVTLKITIIQTTNEFKYYHMYNQS